MSDPKLARRYARALYNAARDQDAVDPVSEGLRDALVPLLADRTFRIWWRSRRIPLARKLDAIDEAFAGVHVVARQFLKLLLEKKREDVLVDAVREFGAIVDRERGVLRATLTTTVELADDDLKPFREMLAAYAAGDVHLDHNVDRSLIGGFRLRFGDRVMDGSVRRALDSLRGRMAAGG
ncbi:MAG: ATP synthase subunit delta [Calditrichaeota bacterium]|nr:ATP synthase subunit delta [Calditrichota bacterium]